jgi:hypothetical protein
MAQTVKTSTMEIWTQGVMLNGDELELVIVRDSETKKIYSVNWREVKNG